MLIRERGELPAIEQLSAQLNISNLFDETYYSNVGFYNPLAYGSRVMPS